MGSEMCIRDSPSDDAIAEMYAAADKDGDGRISYAEFTTLMVRKIRAKEMAPLSPPIAPVQVSQTVTTELTGAQRQPALAAPGFGGGPASASRSVRVGVMEADGASVPFGLLPDPGPRPTPLSPAGKMRRVPTLLIARHSRMRRDV